MQVKHWIVSMVTLILLGFSVLAATPTISSVRIDPDTSVYTNYSLIGYCTGDDADNDSIKYEFIWYRNDTQWATGFLVNDTVSSYQETADSITASEAALYDGDWTTSGSGTESIEENYTLPFYGVGFEWIRGSSSSNQTYSNIDACRYAYPDKISFLASTTNLFGGSRSEYCWNGTGWQVLLSNTFYDPIYETAINWQLMPDPKPYGVEQQISKVNSHLTTRYENWTLSCRVADASSNSSWVNSSTIYILDAPATMQAANISPQGTTGSDSNLIGFCQASDIDGDLIDYEYNWTRNGVPNITGTISNVASGTYLNVANISSAATFDADSWVLYCRGVSTTGAENSSWLASAATTISNPGPNVTYISPADGTDVSDPASIIISVHDDNSNVSEVNVSVYYPNGTLFYANNSGSINTAWYNRTIQLTGFNAFGRYIINTTTRDSAGDGFAWASRGIDFITPYITWHDDFNNSNYTIDGWTGYCQNGLYNSNLGEGNAFDVDGLVQFFGSCGSGPSMYQNLSATKGIRYNKDFFVNLTFKKGFPNSLPPKDIWLTFVDDKVFSSTSYIFVGLAVEGTGATDLRIFCGGGCSCADTSVFDNNYTGQRYDAYINYNYTSGLMNYTRSDGLFVNTTISGCDFSEYNTALWARQGDISGNDQSSAVYDFRIGTVCRPNWACTSYGSCSGHVQQCLAANDSNTCNASVNLSTMNIVCNSNPSINVTVNNTSPLFNSSIKCLVSMSDPDGDNASTTEYQWKNNGLNISTVASQDLIISNLTYYNLTCNSRVNDSYGGSSGWIPSANYAIVANTPPVISNVQLGPIPAYASSPITCNWSYSDINSNPENASIIKWLVNGVEVSQVAYTGSYPSLSNLFYSGGDNVTCAVKGYDDISYSGSFVNNSLLVSNSAPTFTSISISPTTAIRSSTLTCIIGGVNDLDGDAITKYYQFRDTDNTTVLQNYSTLDTFVCNSTTSCTSGDIIYCTAYINDGQANSSSMTAAKNITNAQPEARNVYITPTLPDDNSTLTCNYTYYDADNDPEFSVQYKWFLNGTVQGTTSQTLNSALTTDFDKWSCEVKVNDGFQDSKRKNSTEVWVGANNPHNIIITDSGVVDETTGTITFYWTWIDPQLPSGGPYTHYVCNTSNINGSGCLSGTQLCAVTDDISPTQCTYNVPASTPSTNTMYVLIKDGSGLESLVAQHEWTYNHRPTATNITLNVTSTGIYNTYTCLLNGVSDIDGDELLKTYTFLNSTGGTLQAYSATNTYIVNSGAATHGDNVICRARVNDGRVYSIDYSASNQLRVASVSHSSQVFVDTFTTITADVANETNLVGVNLTLRDPYYVQFSDIPMVLDNLTGNWKYTFAPNIVGQWIISKVYAVDSNGQSYVFRGSSDSFTVTTQQGGNSGGGGGETTIREIPVIGNITGFCGDGVCRAGENPSNCYADCKVNYDSLVACLFDKNIECNYSQSWFPLALIGFLGVITVISLFLSSTKKKKVQR